MGEMKNHTPTTGTNGTFFTSHMICGRRVLMEGVGDLGNKKHYLDMVESALKRTGVLFAANACVFARMGYGWRLWECA